MTVSGPVGVAPGFGPGAGVGVGVGGGCAAGCVPTPVRADSVPAFAVTVAAVDATSVVEPIPLLSVAACSGLSAPTVVENVTTTPPSG